MKKIDILEIHTIIKIQMIIQEYCMYFMRDARELFHYTIESLDLEPEKV